MLKKLFAVVAALLAITLTACSNASPLVNEDPVVEETTTTPDVIVEEPQAPVIEEPVIEEPVAGVAEQVWLELYRENQPFDVSTDQQIIDSGYLTCANFADKLDEAMALMVEIYGENDAAYLGGVLVGSLCPEYEEDLLAWSLSASWT